jgi:uncharacterized membrane protein (TIGR02234 family)
VAESAASEARPESGAAGPRAARPGARLMWTVVLVLVLAAVALWAASRFTWSWSVTRTPLRGNVVERADGSQAVPALVPLALLSLAGVAALLAVGGWLRRVVGALLLIAGLAVLWLAGSDLGAVFGSHPSGYPASQVLAGHTFALLGGVLLVLVGVLVLRAAGRLPKLGSRYETPARAKRAPNPDAALWQELSEGRDPTSESPRDEPRQGPQDEPRDGTQD